MGWSRNIRLKKTLKTIRKKRRNKLTFITIAKKAVTGVQTPSYTSATHQWQGNADNLKKKPKRINTIEKINSHKVLNPSVPKNNCTSKKSNEPTIPNKILIPNKSTPDAMAPKEKYLIAASIDTILWFKIAAKTYNVKLNPSNAKYTPKKSYEDVKTNKKKTEKPITKGNSSDSNFLFKTKRVFEAYNTLMVKIRIHILDTFVNQQLINVNPNAKVVSLELVDIKHKHIKTIIKKKSQR